MAGQESPKRLSKTEAVQAIVSKVQPEYPPVAKQLKLEGTVELEAMIAPDGTVDDVKILTGNPVLTRAAAQALKKWKFAPVLEDGEPARAVAPITISFKL
jgi:TonB family protein